MLERIGSQTERMTLLVEDLLLLARLDAGRPLAREPVDLARLVVDAVSDAHATSPGHRWSLDLPDPDDDPAGVTVTGDPERLHQVVANLLANARTHTPPGTNVVVGLLAGGARRAAGGARRRPRHRRRSSCRTSSSASPGATRPARGPRARPASGSRSSPPWSPSTAAPSR